MRPERPADRRASGRVLSRPAAAQQAAALVERDQVVTAADMGVADEDLRHGAAAGEGHHVVALHRVQVDADLFDRRTPRCLSSALARWQ
jgi:hypothetical protein